MADLVTNNGDWNKALLDLYWLRMLFLISLASYHHKMGTTMTGSPTHPHLPLDPFSWLSYDECCTLRIESERPQWSMIRPVGLIADGQLLSSESLNHNQKDLNNLASTKGSEPVESTDESHFTYTIPYDHQKDHPYLYAHERGKGSGKAVVGWLKLKAALRWGIFIRELLKEGLSLLSLID
ncbi:hypothetical protein F3Y22_tig00110890pilonHSYRG01321 [Hibiscus syriacus]|uniref:Uncharacterized protein n=1 Tax=Hibiscus syriacus TaxID=106335 RepID=A0A6A2ZHD6_HIBSY|nr:hypothetical protein F3Y22_tig00110890pilonHSYRG01321 [Hibiscus syriacus]